MDPRVTVVKVGTLCLEPSDLPGSITYRCKHDLGIGGGSVAGLKTRIAIAGDAIISYSYWSVRKIWNHNSDFYDKGEVEESTAKLIEVSDIIIPGHGTPFMVRKDGHWRG